MCGITSGAVKIETTFFVRFPVPDVTPYVVDSADIRQITQLVYLLIANRTRTLLPIYTYIG